MKIAFTSTGQTWDSIIDSRFGRTDFILVYNEETQELNVLDNSSTKNAAHGAGTATSQKLYDIKPDILITGNVPGDNALQALKNLNMDIYTNAHNISINPNYSIRGRF